MNGFVLRISIWPYMIVEVVGIPSSCAVWIRLIHCAVSCARARVHGALRPLGSRLRFRANCLRRRPSRQANNRGCSLRLISTRITPLREKIRGYADSGKASLSARHSLRNAIRPYLGPDPLARKPQWRRVHGPLARDEGLLQSAENSPLRLSGRG